VRVALTIERQVKSVDGGQVIGQQLGPASAQSGARSSAGGVRGSRLKQAAKPGRVMVPVPQSATAPEATPTSPAVLSGPSTGQSQQINSALPVSELSSCVETVTFFGSRLVKILAICWPPWRGA
jgi:hypothetical protein